MIERAEILREKGTNRKQFALGKVDKYSWVDVGSSYLPSEITAAFLWAQLEEAERITRERRRIWDLYHEAFAALELTGLIRRPIVPKECQHNAHMYYVLVPDLPTRTGLLETLNVQGINAVFHYRRRDRRARPDDRVSPGSPVIRRQGREHGTVLVRPRA